MELLRDDKGNVWYRPLLAFRTANILGMTVVVTLAYQDADNKSEALQLSLMAGQCRELSQQLLSQAAVLELERPTAPQ